MQTYIPSIIAGLLTFPSVAALFTVPYAIYIYRKRGRLDKWSTFIFYLYILYYICALALVLYPMPDSYHVEEAAGTQLIPFHFVRVLIETVPVRLTQPSTYKLLLTNMEFLQVAFNILLMVPMGVFVRYREKKSFLKTVLVCFFISLLFETIQITAFFGMYSAAWRVFDVDDLFLNTLGGAIGWWITPALVRFLPAIKEGPDAESELKAVSFFRRTVAFLCDSLPLFVLFLFLFSDTILAGFATALLYALILTFSGGRSLGLWLTRLKITGRHGKPKFRENLLRCVGFYLATGFVIQALSIISISQTDPKLQSIPVLLQFAYVIVLIVVTIIAAVRHRPLLADTISRTKVESVPNNV